MSIYSARDHCGFPDWGFPYYNLELMLIPEWSGNPGYIHKFLTWLHIEKFTRLSNNTVNSRGSCKKKLKSDDSFLKGTSENGWL